MVTRVYLDQWVWVRLAQVADGQQVPPGMLRPLEETLTIARYGVHAGLLSFPLSTSHYIETYRRRSAASRYRLARVMAELSRFDVILPAHRLLQYEIDYALRTTFGKPYNTRSVDVFGKGIAYLFGHPDLVHHLPDDVPVPNELRPRIEAFIDQQRELALLAGPDEDQDPDDDAAKPSWVAYEEDVARRMRGAGFQHKQHQFLSAIEWVEMLDPINEACLRAGLSPVGVIDSLGRDGMEEFLLSMPCRGTIHRVRREQHKNAGRKREEGDVHDMEPLSVAVVHCDIVVAETYHGELLRRSGADTRFGTRLVTRLADLPSTLVSATAKRAG